MNLTEQSIENLILNVTQEIHVRASLDATFAALLEEIGPHNEAGDGKHRRIADAGKSRTKLSGSAPHPPIAIGGLFRILRSMAMM